MNNQFILTKCIKHWYLFWFWIIIQINAFGLNLSHVNKLIKMTWWNIFIYNAFLITYLFFKYLVYSYEMHKTLILSLILNKNSDTYICFEFIEFHHSFLSIALVYSFFFSFFFTTQYLQFSEIFHSCRKTICQEWQKNEMKNIKIGIQYKRNLPR